MDNIIEGCLKEIKELMRKNANKKYKSKVYYEYRITTELFRRLEVPLLKLYQKAFEQGVYVSKK